MKAQKAVACLLTGLLAAVPVRIFWPETAAADETEIVTVSISREIAAADGTFTATVFLDELPASGLCAVDFAVAYDPTVLSISDVELLYDTGADDAEAAVNPDLAGTVFTWEDVDGEVRIRWATALKNADYWLREERAFFTISGQVSAEALPISRCDLRLVPASRETHDGSGVINTLIVAGYVDADGNSYNCETWLNDGVVWKPKDETGVTIAGDVDLDGAVTISDAIQLHKLVAEECTLGAAAYANADCESDGILTIADVTLILQYLDGQIEGTALGIQ